MKLDAAPRLTEPEEVAVLRALAVARVPLNGTPPAYMSAWKLAAISEAVGDQVSLSGTWQCVPEGET